MSECQPKRSKVLDFFIGGFATMGATVFSNPFEVVKTRLQLQGELQTNHKKHYTGIFNSFYQMIKNEGIFSVQKGLVAGLVYQFFMNGTRLGSYGYLQPRLIQKDDKFYYLKNTLLATFSGSIGGMVGSPFFLIKTRLQSASNSIKIGHQHEYKGFIDGVKNIIKNDGFSGLFKGTKAAALRVAVGSSVQLPSYDQFKLLLTKNFPNQFKDGTLTHFTASLLAGFLVTTAMNPFDVISTRIYNENTKKGEGDKYKGIQDCAFKTWKVEGIKGLFKGWTAHYARLAPHTILTFVFWEKLKLFANKYF